MASYIGRGMQHKPLDQTNLKNSVVASLEAVGNRCTKERLTHGSHMLSGIRVGPPGPTWKPLGFTSIIRLLESSHIGFFMDLISFYSGLQI
jgi:hypothetical protein